MTLRIAVLTADESVPGMNAAIRGVTRRALEYGWQVMGLCNGESSLITCDFISLSAGTVDGMIPWGGSLLDYVDSRELLTESGKQIALRRLSDAKIDALIIIGGAEAVEGALALAQLGFKTNVVAASVENDLYGFDTTIGMDSALNAALETIDEQKMTCAVDEYLCFVEVAGRRCGYLALLAAIVGGADGFVIPEVETTLEQIADDLQAASDAGCSCPVIVVAEGAGFSAYRLRRHFNGDIVGRRAKIARLSHSQRRAAPSAFDRILGMRLGAAAVDALADGEGGVVVGLCHGEAHSLPLAEVAGRTRELDTELLHLGKIFARQLSILGQ